MYVGRYKPSWEGLKSPNEDSEEQGLIHRLPVLPGLRVSALPPVGYSYHDSSWTSEASRGPIQNQIFRV